MKLPIVPIVIAATVLLAAIFFLRSSGPTKRVPGAPKLTKLVDIEGVETIGVVSALSDAEDIADIVAAFRFHRVIVTNMDRTRRLGAALAACLSGASLAHVTHGPRPEDGLDMLEPGALADQLLEVFPH